MEQPPRNQNPLMTTQAGSRHGLKLTLFIDADEYMGLLAPNVGARIAIHDRTVEPIMKTQSIAVSVGEATFLDIRAQRIRFLRLLSAVCFATFLRLESLIL